MNDAASRRFLFAAPLSRASTLALSARTSIANTGVSTAACSSFVQPRTATNEPAVEIVPLPLQFRLSRCGALVLRGAWRAVHRACLRGQEAHAAESHPALRTRAAHCLDSRLCDDFAPLLEHWGCGWASSFASSLLSPDLLPAGGRVLAVVGAFALSSLSPATSGSDRTRHPAMSDAVSYDGDVLMPEAPQYLADLYLGASGHRGDRSFERIERSRCVFVGGTDVCFPPAGPMQVGYQGKRHARDEAKSRAHLLATSREDRD